MKAVETAHCTLASHALTTLLFLSSYANSALVGGWRKQDPHHNAGYLQLAHYVASSQTHGLKNYNTVVRLLEVSTQVVAGLNYRLIFTIAPTNCVIGRGEYSPHVCRPVSEENAVCSTIIYIVPWKKQISVTSYRCRDIKPRHFPKHHLRQAGGVQNGNIYTKINLK
ncbi:cystatin-2 [Rhipicephalus microplus]|uniref:cystatin-2 n=1 Tax=Rhipicephalus microplus TaxID=6941 RepID=UPI003F6D5D70